MASHHSGEMTCKAWGHARGSPDAWASGLQLFQNRHFRPTSLAGSRSVDIDDWAGGLLWVTPGRTRAEHIESASAPNNGHEADMPDRPLRARSRRFRPQMEFVVQCSPSGLHQPGGRSRAPIAWRSIWYVP